MDCQPLVSPFDASPAASRPVSAPRGCGSDTCSGWTRRSLVWPEPAEYALDEDEFEKAVWGAIELHRTSLVWPLLRVWTSVRPNSSAAWTMTGWAHQVDGDPDRAQSILRRALDLDTPGTTTLR